MLTEFATLGIALPPRAQGLPATTINLEFAKSSVTQQAGTRRCPSNGLRAVAPGVAALRLLAKFPLTAVAPSHVCHRNTGIAGYARPAGIGTFPNQLHDHRRRTSHSQPRTANATRSPHVRTQRENRSVH